MPYILVSKQLVLCWIAIGANLLWLACEQLVLLVQALQDKVAASSRKVSELETQLGAEHERGVSAEEQGRTLARQLAEQQQESAHLAKKREDSEAELATQVRLLLMNRHIIVSSVPPRASQL